MCDFRGSYPSSLGAYLLDDRTYVFTVRPWAKPSNPFLNVAWELPNFGANLPNFWVVFRRQIGGQRIVASGTVWIELQQTFITEAPQH